MKTIITFFSGLLFFITAKGQTTEITPELQQKLRQAIELQVPAFKKKLEKEKLNPGIIAFFIDTFRIERLLDRSVELNFSDFSMRDANYTAAAGYDSLLNKYYKKLLNQLKGDDKKLLQQAQKNWIAFRDSETKLVETISKDEYSGGGTMQELTESSMYLDIIKRRVLAIFSHYSRAAQIN
jgi:uncharacterized protein YecT (DUF1311 family)